jgi:formate-dependent nitrite reductase cytochrome c552 subunit
MEVNKSKRTLKEEHAKIILSHGERKGWCFECHNPDDRDKLRLASGELVGFDESYKLCGQCHGPKLRDWKAGVHGRRTGEWNGEKEYYLCAHCHDPHSPRFKPLEPEPPPGKPEE